LVNNYLTTFLYINSNNFLDGRANSVYELSVYRNLLYIPDYRNDKVIVVDIETKKHVKDIAVPMPHGVEIDENGIVYISCYKKNRIHIHDGDREKEITYEKMDFPVSISARKDKVYIANWGQGQRGGLLVADKKFRSIEEFGRYEGRFKPHSILALDDGYVYVVNRGEPSIVVFDERGSLNRVHMLNKDFDPISLTAYNQWYIIPNYVDGMIYIFDKKFNVLGNFFGGDRYPMSTVVYDKKLFISEQDGNRIHSISLSNLKLILKTT